MDTPYREGSGLASHAARRLLREHRWTRNPRVVLAAVPFGIVLAFQTWVFLTTDRSRWGSSDWFSFNVTAFLMLASVAYVASRAQSQKGDVALVFDDGIVHHRSGTLTEIAWDDIVSLTGGARRHVLRGAGGASMVFTPELEGLPELVAELRARVVRRFVPDALVAFDAGHALDFGTLRLSRDAIAGVAWRDVEAVDTDPSDGSVRVRTRGELADVVVDRVPNAPVILALAEHALRGPRRLG